MAISMGVLVSAIVAATVSVILVGSVLAPQVSEYTASGGALADYAGLLGAVVVITIVGILMIGVRLITKD